jgi:hypothetical protein
MFFPGESLLEIRLGSEGASTGRPSRTQPCQNCAKTLSNCNVGAYFEREVDSPKLLETLGGESKGRNRWEVGSCLQSRCSPS